VFQPTEVVVREVSVRDGLQSEAKVFSARQRADLIDKIARAGFRRINAVSFVSPSRVPQMADAEKVMELIDRVPGVLYDASVPNPRGARRAVSCEVDAISVFIATSDAANRRNVGRSVRESLDEVADIVAIADGAGIPVVGSILNSFVCPYAGPVPIDTLVEIERQMLGSGCRGLLLGDTAGSGVPTTVHAAVSATLDTLGSEADLYLHFHDTRGAGLANVVAAMDAGATMFDASLAGIGGCPFIEGASGNIVTEDLVTMLHTMGISTGVSLDSAIPIAQELMRLVDHPVPSNILKTV
jgi:hydroxymethylglutaryl-CoA lyase